MTETEDTPTEGARTPWSRSDARSWPEEGCAACGEPLVVGEPVVERPPVSERFFHADSSDCARG